MRYLVNSQEMKSLDGYSIHTMGIPSVVLMERAALSVTEEIYRRMPCPSGVLILCGCGNNGADGLAMARMMTLHGDEVHVIVAGNRGHATEEWNTQMSICEKMGICIEDFIENPVLPPEERIDVVVDSMLGTGLSREVQGTYCQVIEKINCFPAFKVAVDIPSGISADTGAVLGTAFHADLTVSFQFGKLGTFLFPGAEYAGDIIVRDIGILPQGLNEIHPSAYTLDVTDMKALPQRTASSNKGTYGKVLIIAGSHNMAGAALLAGEAAYRMGAGLIRILTPECNRSIIQTALPEAILTTYEDTPSDDIISDCCRWASAVVIGPGLGTMDAAVCLVDRTLEFAPCPVVIDADALNILASHPDWMHRLTSQHILTPHLGEMSRLTGRSVRDIKADPVRSVLDFIEDYPCILVQKDARTITANRAHDLYVNTCGNSGMSTGGSGDVLSGTIGSLIGQGAAVWDAAVLAVLCHGLAGDKAAQEMGERAVLARDIVRCLGR